MNKLLATGLLALMLICIAGCVDDPPGDVDNWTWQTMELWPRGSAPVGGPDHGNVLFLQEEAPAGLYLLTPSNAMHLNPSGPAARADYAWSADGERFAFSSPGVSGTGEAGIYVANHSAPMVFTKLWDRGSHPRFLPAENAIICAGPEASGDSVGIWQIDLAPIAFARIAADGVEPEISPDGIKVAYLIPGGAVGRILVALNRETCERDTLAGNVLNFSWLGDSQTLVYEVGATGGQEIRSIEIESDEAPRFEQFGTLPRGLFDDGTGFVYTGLAGDRLDGVFLSAARSEQTQRISTRGTQLRPLSRYSILAQDSSGIIEIGFRLGG